MKDHQKEEKTMKKARFYGSGSVYQTAEKRWGVKVSLGALSDGTPLMKKFSVKTKEEAEKNGGISRTNKMRRSNPSLFTTLSR